MEIKPYDELKVSTMTVVTYSNVAFDLRKIFENLPIAEVEVPLTKKKRQPDIKKLVAPTGSIISLRIGNEFRGIHTKVKPTVRQQNYSYFLNQVTAIVSVGDKNLNTMIFNSKMKIVGNKNAQQAMDAVLILWRKICAIPDSYRILEKGALPRFVFDVVMTNVDFKLGFKIDRRKLNNLMNDTANGKLVYLSRFENTENTNVNIKMFAQKPNNFKYVCIEVQPNGRVKLIRLEKNPYIDAKAEEKKKDKYTTFLVFRSSKVIESGRYAPCMKNSYDAFIDLMKTNRSLIEEKLLSNEDTYIHEKLNRAKLDSEFKATRPPPEDAYEKASKAASTASSTASSEVVFEE